MKNLDLTAPMHDLVARLRAWDELADGARLDDPGLSARERRAMIDEVLALAGAPPRAATPWRSLLDLFAQRAADPREERLQREVSVLRGYEQLCERELPFDVSSVLLRHYSAIKRASHAANDARRSPPTPARGTPVLRAAPARAVAR